MRFQLWVGTVILSALFIFTTAYQPKAEETMLKCNLFNGRDFDIESEYFYFELPEIDKKECLYYMDKDHSVPAAIEGKIHELEKRVSSSPELVSSIRSSIKRITQKLPYPEINQIVVAISYILSMSYVSDEKLFGKDYYQYPIEFLLAGKGDCDDQVIALKWILKGMGYDCIWVSVKRTGGQLSHLQIAVNIDQNIVGAAYQELWGKRYYFVDFPSGQPNVYPIGYLEEGDEITAFNPDRGESKKVNPMMIMPDGKIMLIEGKESREIGKVELPPETPPESNQGYITRVTVGFGSKLMKYINDALGNPHGEIYISRLEGGEATHLDIIARPRDGQAPIMFEFYPPKHPWIETEGLNDKRAIISRQVEFEWFEDIRGLGKKRITIGVDDFKLSSDEKKILEATVFISFK